jgi:hypothetical protein
MKLSSNNLLETLTVPQLENLTFQVKETLDISRRKQNEKIFSAADLWDIQRRRKYNSGRRFFQQ